MRSRFGLGAENSATRVVVAVFFALSLRLYGQDLRPVADDRVSDSAFRQLVVDYSEPDRTFRSSGAVRADNLVSNERSFQQLIPILQSRQSGGAYIGVGPEQNFTYITAIRPAIAFIIDIRRDNMLLHLWYKAIAELSTDRLEFAVRLFSRQHQAVRSGATVNELLDAFAATQCSEELLAANVSSAFERLENVHGFHLSDADRGSIRSAARRFCSEGPNIRWDTTGDSWIPTYRDLMAETDSSGRKHSYLASEELFQLFKRYEQENRIVPLVGDFGGGKTFAAVGAYLTRRHLTLAAFYVSNVEGYLKGEARVSFIRNVSSLPLDKRSIFIRAIFHIVGRNRSRLIYETSIESEPILEWADAIKSRQN